VLKADPRASSAIPRGGGRRTTVQPTDGMAWFGALLTAGDAALVDAAVTAHARTLDRTATLHSGARRAGGTCLRNGTHPPQRRRRGDVPFDT